MIEYIKNGPEDADSFAENLIGIYLWWRVWVSLAITFAGIVLVGYLSGQSDSALVGFGIGYVIALLAREFGDR